jgi:uncharacterized membrane protein YqjE
MSALSLIWGVLATVGFFFGFIPFLGWLNWFNIPFAFVGLVISVIALSTAERDRAMAIVGVVLCAVATVFGAFRLAFGGGVF